MEKELEYFETQNPSSIKEKTNITDLNVDCMENIFECLDLNDLLSLSNTSKIFYVAVCRVYKKIYGHLKLTYSQNFKEKDLFWFG